MIRRLVAKDAEAVAAFLKATYEADPFSGGNPTVPNKDSCEQWAERELTWVCEENTKIIGVLHCAGQGEMGGEGWKMTFSLFTLLAVDYALYKTARSDAAEIACELSKQSCDDLVTRNMTTDLIRIVGPLNSRGAHWTVALKANQLTTKGNDGDWVLPFNLIWERADAAVAAV